MDRYHLTCTDNVNAFEDWVCARLEEGYELHGTPFCTPDGRFAQAFVSSRPLIAETSGVGGVDELSCVAFIKIDEKPFRVSYADHCLSITDIATEQTTKVDIVPDLKESGGDQWSEEEMADASDAETGGTDPLPGLTSGIKFDSSGDYGVIALDANPPTDQEMADLSDADLVPTAMTGKALGQAIEAYGAAKYMATVIAGQSFLAKWPKAQRDDYSLFRQGTVANKLKDDGSMEFVRYSDDGGYIFYSADKPFSLNRIVIAAGIMAIGFAALIVAAVNGWLP